MNSLKGENRDNPILETLKKILNYVKLYFGDSIFIKDGIYFFEMIEKFKIERYQYTALWKSLVIKLFRHRKID